MAIPKGILKSTQDLRESLSLYTTAAAPHVNFEAPNDEHFRSIDTLMDSHP